MTRSSASDDAALLAGTAEGRKGALAALWQKAGTCQADPQARGFMIISPVEQSAAFIITGTIVRVGRQ